MHFVARVFNPCLRACATRHGLKTRATGLHCPNERMSDARMLRHELLAVGKAAEAIDRGQVRFGGGFEDVSAHASSPHLSAVMLQLDVHFTLRILALADGADAIIDQAGVHASETLNRGVDR